MRRLLRRVFKVAAALSALLFVAMATGWFASYWEGDGISYSRGLRASGYEWGCELASELGGVGIMYWRQELDTTDEFDILQVGRRYGWSRSRHVPERRLYLDHLSPRTLYRRLRFDLELVSTTNVSGDYVDYDVEAPYWALCGAWAVSPATRLLLPLAKESQAANRILSFLWL